MALKFSRDGDRRRPGYAGPLAGVALEDPGLSCSRNEVIAVVTETIRRKSCQLSSLGHEHWSRCGRSLQAARENFNETHWRKPHLLRCAHSPRSNVLLIVHLRSSTLARLTLDFLSSL